MDTTRAALLPLLLQGCAGPGVPTVVVDPAPERVASPAPAPGDPWPAFAETVGAAGRAMLAAARGQPHDPAWDCDPDKVADLRSTTNATRDQLRELGPLGAPLVYFIFHLNLVTENRALPGGKSWFGLRGDVWVFPDGRVHWAAPSVEAINGERALPITLLPPSLRAELTSLTASLGAGECPLAPVTNEDLRSARLPDRVRAEMERERLNDPVKLGEVCAKLRGAKGPWRAAAESLAVVFSKDQQTVTLMSELAAVDQKLCLGAVSAKVIPRE